MSGSIHTSIEYVYKGQLSKKALEKVGLTPCQMFYFFFAAFTGFFAFAFLTIFNMKICLLLYKFMLVGLSYLPFKGTFRMTSKRIILYLTDFSMCQNPTIWYLIDTHNS